MNSRWLRVGLLVFVGILAALGYVGVRARATQKLNAELALAKLDLTSGRHSTARKRLTELARQGGGNGEVEYLLGLCELQQGRRDAALAAWERVPPSSPWAAQAAAERGLALIDAGQLARAEEVLLAARRRAASAGSLPLLQAIGLLYEMEGRTEQMRQSIIESWAYTRSPAKLVQKLSLQDTAPLPVETLRKALGIEPSDDDRVWLGRASLAIRTGDLDAASHLLDECVKRRPDDPVVWRAILELAQAAGATARVWEALEHLPADAVGGAGRARIRGWLAGKVGDTRSERAALSELLELEPGDAAALDRMATLAAMAGDDREAVKIRARRAKVTAAWVRYHELLKGEPAESGHAERARLAEFLGRTIEARGWSLLRDHAVGPAGRLRPRLDADPTNGRADTATRPTAHSLAALFADLRPGPSPRQPAAPAAEPRYVDTASTAGLHFIQDNADSPLKRPPETMSGGVAVLDYDRDGWLDVYAVQGGPLPPPAGEPCGDRLFRNRGDGTFADVTDAAGIGRLSGGYGHGVAVGDYDNDGYPDLFITRWQSYALVRNRGDGTFEDATQTVGLGGNRDWPTSAAWADLDSDGDLDLYVCHYLAFDLNSPRICASAESHVNHYCSPRDFNSLPDHVFRNDGGRFVDVTREAGFVDPDGRGLGIVAADLDDDNRIDLYVANDMSANYLFRNLGGFRFEETALPSGAATNSSGGYQSGMGVACADFDGDGRPDLAVTNFYGESTTFFRNLGQRLFCDDTAAVGLAAPTRCLLGFGVAFLDSNNDGYLDLISANGHINDHRPSIPWKMPTQLLLGGPHARLRIPPGDGGEPFRIVHLGRGLADGDLDNDGRTDVLVQSQNEPLAYLHNETQGAGHWVTLQLEGVRSNRDGVGARVSVLAAGRRRVAQRTGGGSYQSAPGPRLHFGLGQATTIEQIEVRWPSGQVDRYTGLRADTGYKLREGNGRVLPLAAVKQRAG